MKKLIAMVFTAAFVLAASTSWAQASENGDQTGGSAESTKMIEKVRSKPMDCSKATITGAQFLDMIHAVATHGDLTDSSFIEKTMQIKFDVKEVISDPGSTRSYRYNVYSAYSVHGLPVSISLRVDMDKKNQQRNKELASIFLNNLASPSGCFDITTGVLESKFAGKYFTSVSMDGVKLLSRGAELSNFGRNQAKYLVSYSYEPDLAENMGKPPFGSELVRTIKISQIP